MGCPEYTNSTAAAAAWATACTCSCDCYFVTFPSTVGGVSDAGALNERDSE
jgi:hypothetical protein